MIFQTDADGKVVYTDTMRILIAPLVLKNSLEAPVSLSRDLAELFVRSGHITAVSAPKGVRFSSVSFYPAPSPAKPLIRTKSGRSYEEWLSSNGCLREKYLRADTQHILETIDAFRPDLIISMDRPGAAIAARVRGIRSFVFVHPAMYRAQVPPYKTLRGLNSILSDCHLEQEYSIAGLYSRCERRISFGTPDTAGFRAENDITRIGVIKALPQRPSNTGDPVISLSGTDKSASFLNTLVKETFSGAPYPVYAWFEGSKNETVRSLHILAKPALNRLNTASVLVHDGNSAMYHTAIACGIPQIIITDHVYSRIWDAQTIQRCGCGLYIFEEELSVSKLYEAFRRILSDDSFETNCRRIRQESLRYGDLNTILSLL